MRDLSPAVLEAISDPATVIVTCWDIERQDGVVVRMTDFDQEVIVDSETYLPNGSTDRTAIRLSDGLSPDNLDIKGVFNSDLITDDDLQNGLYDYADLKVFLAFAENGPDETIPLLAGRFGLVESDGAAYSVEINSITQALMTQTGEVTTPTCRAAFGDERCRIDLSAYRHEYTLDTVEDGRTMTVVEGRQLALGSYVNGEAYLVDGDGIGLRTEIRAEDWPQILLMIPFPVIPKSGDKIELTAGCDKRRVTCVAFNNIENFQGEPDIPGIDALIAPESV